jgi:surface polysaccharide O-acyltransferase-like enzyme
MAALGLFPASCAASSFALLAIFVRFAGSRIGFLESLARNSYGIFLIHFAFVSWLGYALLGAALPALVKFLLVTAGALALSWGATILLRRIPGAARIL